MASFIKIGDSGEKNLGERLAIEIALQLGKDLAEIRFPVVIHILGPEQGVRSIRGETPEQRAQTAEKIAGENGYFMVVNGTVDTTGPVWRIVPEFFVSPAALPNLYEVDEIAGQHDLG